MVKQIPALLRGPLTSSTVPDVIQMMAKMYRVTPVEVQVDYLKYAKAKPKACFDNVYHYCSSHPGTSYVVGFLLHKNIPVEHAWVKKGDKHFDVTLATGADRYFALFDLEPIKFLQVINQCGQPPGLYECVRYL